ncbi:hypothetical protein ACPA9J_19115 [Pseudomonas aeruginosa]
MTIVYQGESSTTTSTGAGGLIGRGVQWMTAASGSSRRSTTRNAFRSTGGTLEMVLAHGSTCPPATR